MNLSVIDFAISKAPGPAQLMYFIYLTSALSLNINCFLSESSLITESLMNSTPNSYKNEYKFSKIKLGEKTLVLGDHKYLSFFTKPGCILRVSL